MFVCENNPSPPLPAPPPFTAGNLLQKAKLNPSSFYPRQRSAVWKEQRPLIRSDLRRFEEFANTAPSRSSFPSPLQIDRDVGQFSTLLSKQFTQEREINTTPPSELSPLASVHKITHYRRVSYLRNSYALKLWDTA